MGSRKFYISADMEGVAGVVTDHQLSPEGFEWERYREFMTLEVLEAIDAARGAGFDTFVVSDSHGTGENLLIDRFETDTTIVRSWPRPLAMVEGIDDTFAAAAFIGYHSATTNPRGVRAHTMSSANLTAIRLHGEPASEALINAAIAGHFGVPVVAMSGDDAAVEETQSLLGPVGGAVTKWTCGFHSARTLTPVAARARIREAVTEGLAGLQDRTPYVVPTPVPLELRFKHRMPPEMLAYLPMVNRVDAHTVRFVGKDMVEVSHFIEFALNYRADATP